MHPSGDRDWLIRLKLEIERPSEMGPGTRRLGSFRAVPGPFEARNGEIRGNKGARSDSLRGRRASVISTDAIKSAHGMIVRQEGRTIGKRKRLG